MSTRPQPDAVFPPRASHVVETPDRYGNWRDYAFSSAPELMDGPAGELETDNASDLAPNLEAPTV